VRLERIGLSLPVPKTGALSVELQALKTCIIIPQMVDISEQIKQIQKEIRETPYHKGTEHYIGRLRARISRLKDKEMWESVKSRGGGGGGYAVKHQGDATIILIGPPSVGKSTLLNKLTNASSKVAPYAFTTVSVIPGMMEYKNARIQILDVPGLIEGAEEGKGRGREVLSVARGSDLLIIMSEVGKIEAIERIKNALERNGIRIDQRKPDLVIEKKLEGGIIIHSNIKQDFDRETVKEISQEFGIKNAEITIKEKLTFNRLVDAFSLNRVYIPSLSVINKIDLVYNQPRADKQNSIINISAEKDIGLNDLKEDIWNTLRFITIYLVEVDEEPNLKNPVVAKSGDLLTNVAEKIGTDFLENKRSALIWGSWAKYPGQEVSLSTKAQEGMQIRFI
jgi:small GTP-binding protein